MSCLSSAPEYFEKLKLYTNKILAQYWTLQREIWYVHVICSLLSLFKAIVKLFLFTQTQFRRLRNIMLLKHNIHQQRISSTAVKTRQLKHIFYWFVFFSACPHGPTVLPLCQTQRYILVVQSKC